MAHTYTAFNKRDHQKKVKPTEVSVKLTFKLTAPLAPYLYPTPIAIVYG